MKVLNAERISFIGGQHPPVPTCARIQMQKKPAAFQRQKAAAASMDSFWVEIHVLGKTIVVVLEDQIITRYSLIWANKCYIYFYSIAIIWRILHKTCMIKIHVSLNINQPRCPFQLESSYAKPDCSGTETCRKLPKQKQPKMVKGKKQRCHAEASCDVTHGVPECSCNIGFTGDGVKNCKRRLQAFSIGENWYILFLL